MYKAFLINNKKSIAVIAALLLFLLLTYGVYQVTNVSDDVIKPSFYVTADRGELDPDQALKNIKEKGDTVLNGFFNPGFSPDAWWLYVPAKHYAGSYIQIMNPHINIIRIYSVNGNGRIAPVLESGDYFPFKKRLIRDPDFWYPIKTEDDGLLIRVDKKGESMIVPLQIVPDNEVLSQLSNQKSIYGFFAGWMLFLLVLNFFLWLSLKDNIHFFYILYITTTALWLFSNWGIGFQYLWPEQIGFSNKSRPFFASLGFLFLLELTKRFFTSPDEKPIYNNLVRMLQFFLLVVTVALLIANISTLNSTVRFVFLTITNLIWLATIVMVGFYVYKSYRRFKTLSFFFITAIGLLLLFTFLNIISQFNVESNLVVFVNKYGSAIGLLAESTILSFGLSRRYDFYKAEKEAAMLALETEKSMLADKLIQAQEEERSRLARELHDGLGGLLGSIRIGAFHRLKPNADAQQWIDKQLSGAIGDLRNIAHDLMPVGLSEKGLVLILEQTIARWNSADDFQVSLHCGIHNRYPLATEAGLYRIVTELLYNAKKHAAATQVFVSLWEENENNTITLMVEDNGCGFDPEKTDGLGWKNIRYRVQYLNGKVSVDSNKKGSTIIIEIAKPK